MLFLHLFLTFLGKCPSPVVLLNPVRVSVVPRRSIYADLSFGLPLLRKQYASQLLSALPWKACWLCCWGCCWSIVATIKFLLQAHLGIYCSIEWENSYWQQAMNMRKWLLPRCKGGEKKVEKKTAENLLLSLQSYFLPVTESSGMSKTDLYLQHAVALIWRCIPRKKQWEPSCGGGSIWSQSASLLVLHLQFLFQAALHCRQVMLKICQEGAVTFCLRLCPMCQLLGQQAGV